ncbi:MAG: MarR family transcriptional regulator [Pseudomonadota bacterium]
MSIEIESVASCDADPSDVRQLVAVFDRFIPLFSRYMHEALSEADTSPARLRILRNLNANGPSAMQSLAEGLCVAPRTITSLVDGLEEEGLVVRKPHPTDRRTRVIEMTEAGKLAYARTESVFEKTLADLLGSLPKDVRWGLLEGQRRLVEKLSERSKL